MFVERCNAKGAKKNKWQETEKSDIYFEIYYFYENILFYFQGFFFGYVGFVN